MRFQLAHKLVTYLLVLAALAALEGTHALSAVSAALFLGACALSFGVDAGTRAASALDRAAAAGRAVALTVGALLLWRIWRRLPDPDYGPGFDLGLALLAYKLFYRRTHRDYVHILAFSFVLVLIASTLTASLLFVAAFAVYVAFAVWGLILFHLRREMEENYLIKHSAQAPSHKVGVGRILGSRRVVGPAFFLATGGVAAAVMTGAIGIFVFVPRLGAGFVLGGPPSSGNGVAAGDEIAIGRYGTRPELGRQVVLRANIPAIAALPDKGARREAADALYFRGATYDVYDRGRWGHSRTPQLGTLVVEDDADPDARRYWVHEPSEGWPPNGALPPGGEREPARHLAATDPEAGDGPTDGTVRQSIDRAARLEIEGAVRQEIEVVGISASVLFAIDRAVALELPAARLGAAGELRILPRWSGETGLRVGMTGTGDGFLTLAHAHYVAYSRPRPDARAAPPVPADAPRPVLAPAARSSYLVLPPGLDRRFGPVAQRLSTPALDLPSNEPGKIASVIAWLRAGHAYSPLPPPATDGVDPVEDFVFTGSKGHCELFASAAVLLLRAGGIPARYVTGFRGGEWNDAGGYVSVRDDRAHAWAEAFLPNAGWVRVDATPPGPPPRPVGRAAELVDALDYLWSRWVVGYDLPRQHDLASRAERRLAPLGASSTWRRPFALGALLATVTGLTGVIVIVGRRRRRGAGITGIEAPAPGRRARGGKRPSPGAIDRLYRRTVRRLERTGWPRHPHETPHEYARRIAASGFYPDGGFDLLTAHYAAARFGGHAIADDEVAELAAKLASGARIDGHPGSAAPTAGP